MAPGGAYHEAEARARLARSLPVLIQERGAIALAKPTPQQLDILQHGWFLAVGERLDPWGLAGLLFAAAPDRLMRRLWRAEADQHGDLGQCAPLRAKL